LVKKKKIAHIVTHLDKAKHLLSGKFYNLPDSKNGELVKMVNSIIFDYPILLSSFLSTFIL